MLLQLAHRVPGQFLDLDDGPGSLERGEAPGALVAEPVDIDTAIHDDVSHGNFATALVRGANDGRFADTVLFEQQLLDFAGINVEPTGDDELRGSTAQRQAAGGVKLAEVARREPAVVERGSGRRGIAPISGK